MSDLDVKTSLQYAWLAVLLVLVLAVMFGSREGALAKAVAIGLVVVDVAVLAWVVRRRSS